MKGTLAHEARCADAGLNPTLGYTNTGKYERVIEKVRVGSNHKTVRIEIKSYRKGDRTKLIEKPLRVILRDKNRNTAIKTSLNI